MDTRKENLYLDIGGLKGLQVPHISNGNRCAKFHVNTSHCFGDIGCLPLNLQNRLVKHWGKWDASKARIKIFLVRACSISTDTSTGTDESQKAMVIAARGK